MYKRQALKMIRKSVKNSRTSLAAVTMKPSSGSWKTIPTATRRRPISVSYTHLDVYKRQKLKNAKVSRFWDKSTMHLLMMTPLPPTACSAIRSMTPTGNSTLLLSLVNVMMSAFPARIPPTIMAWTLRILTAHQFWRWRPVRS